METARLDGLGTEDIEIQPDGVALQCLSVVGQLLAVPDARLSEDVNWDDAGLVLGSDQKQNGVKIGGTLHGQGVVSGIEDNVGHQGIAN